MRGAGVESEACDALLSVGETINASEDFREVTEDTKCREDGRKLSI